ncbi:MAG: hypothetical protein IKQ69_01075 [Oscillospiraceae bacterium]|nr:hypothetical protein [Oscillospiraceae bacterium]
MKTPSKALAYTGLAAALGTVLLLIAGVSPGGKMVMVCLASLGVAFIECLFGWKWALGTFAVTSILALLLLPAKAVAVYYTAFFGYYPLYALLTERIGNRIVRCILRLALFNLVMLLLYFAARSFLTLDFGTLSGYPLLLLLAMNAAFLLYDCALRQGILYLMQNIARRIK